MLSAFYGDVLPDRGYYCLTLLPSGQHQWAESVDELVALTEDNPDHTGVYFGTAAFASVANRKQTNVLALKALRFDIDAGAKKHAANPEGTYPTQRDATAALVQFSKDVGIAPSYIVSSGEGLHVYYVLRESVAPEEWCPLAKAFGQLAAQRGLKVDPSVTTDTARILRPPGTLHPNGKQVTILKETGVTHDVAALRAKLDVKPEPAVRKYDTSINSELSLGYDGPPSSALKIAQHCGALRLVATTGGDVPEPHWRAMIGLVKRTVEGLDIAQEWSMGYDGYDPAEVERKFDAWTTGPTTCAEFAKHCDACTDCPHKGKIKSPINLGLMTTPEIEDLPEEQRPAPMAPSAPTGMPWDGMLPAGFEVMQLGSSPTLVYSYATEKESATGELVPVTAHVPFTHDIFWLGQWAEADHSEDAARVTLHLWIGGRVRSYIMDQSLVASPFKLLEFLASKSIHTTSHKKAAQAMQDYMKAHLLRIRDSGSRPKVTDHLGLRILDTGELVSTHGKHVIYPDGTIREAMLGASLTNVAAEFPLPLPHSDTGEWPLSVWDETILPRARQHVDFLRTYYGDPSMARFQLAILMGLASPLMAFAMGDFHSGSTLPRMGLSVSLYSSGSARGKTTAVSSAILAYGKPANLSNDSGKRGATDNGRMARLSLHGTMPNIMDEMGGASAGSVADMVSAVGNGAAKVRATKEGGLQSGIPWALVNLITTNTSQRSMISAVQDNSGAIQYRLLEIDVEDMPEYDNDLRARFSAAWSAVNRDCTGALGAVIHREICALGPVRANEFVMQCVAKASAAINAGQTDRFQYRGLGLVFALHLLLDRLGLSPFPLQPVVEAFKVAYNAGQEYVEAHVLPTDPLELLNMALLDLAPHTIVTDHETHLGKNSSRFDVPLNARIPDKIVARHIKSTGTTYLSVAALRDWCRERGVRDIDIMRGGRAAGAIVVRQGMSAGAGRKVDRSVTYFDLNKGLKDSMALRCRVVIVQTRRLPGYAAQHVEGGEERDNVVKLRPESDKPDGAEPTSSSGTE